MLSDNIISKIESYCYFIGTGKLVAMEPIRKEDIKEAKKFIKKNGMNYFIKNISRKDWEAFGYSKEIDENCVQIWIYEKPVMLNIIKRMPKRPKTIYDHWVLGKIFSFSDEKIEEYINYTENNIIREE